MHVLEHMHHVVIRDIVGWDDGDHDGSTETAGERR